MSSDDASTTPDGRARVEAIWRIESVRVLATLTRLVRDVDLAEDLAQDALLAALETWPSAGVPDNPGAWLTATAKNRAVDLARRRTRYESKQEQLARDVGVRMAFDGQDLAASIADRLDDRIGDDVLRLIFLCCHPVLAPEGRIALTLRLLGGLTTEEIARAFLVPTPTMAARVTRAKKALREARVAFENPSAADVAERLPSVLEVVYLIFNEGYAATAGDDWVRPALCDEALRLGRVLAARMPAEPEVHGLLALMELQASRTAARTDAAGDPVLLTEQDRGRWDRLLIRRGLAGLARAEQLTGTDRPGPYTLQAAVAACHARARSAPETDWVRIAETYARLAALTGSPVVELNRAVAVGAAFGPAAGLRLADALRNEAALRDYHLLPAVRAEFLVRLGRPHEAHEDLVRAAGLATNLRERTLLTERAARLAAGLAAEPGSGPGPGADCPP